MSNPNPAGQHADQPTFRDPATRTGNSRLWLPALVVILAFLIGAAVLVLSGALTGAGSEPETANPAAEEIEVSPPGVG